MAEVIATKQGYYGKLREPGETFEVPAGLKAGWFAPVDKAESKKPATAKKPPPAGDLV